MSGACEHACVYTVCDSLVCDLSKKIDSKKGKNKLSVKQTKKIQKQNHTTARSHSDAIVLYRVQCRVMTPTRSTVQSHGLRMVTDMQVWKNAM